MKKLDLRTKINTAFVEVPAEFIDLYMPSAPELSVKVYLYLLRASKDPSTFLTVRDLADAFDVTDNKILQALMYWQEQKLLLLDYEGNEISEITLMPISSNKPEEPSEPYSTVVEKLPFTENEPTDYREILSDPMFTELLELTEYYLGKQVNTTMQSALADIYVLLNKKTDMVEYLIEYCLENQHPSPHYMRAVANGWAEQGFTTLEEVKESVSGYNQSVFSVLKALGINGRNPAPVERDWILSHLKNFPTEIIVEACERTVRNVHSADFKYADAILKRWTEAGVTSKEDIASLDKKHEEQKKRPAEPARKSAFRNFDERKTDYDALFKES